METAEKKPAHHSEDEETNSAGLEISFWGVEWDEREGQLQVMGDHKSEVGDVDFILWRISEGYSTEVPHDGEEIAERWSLTSVCRVEMAVG